MIQKPYKSIAPRLPQNKRSSLDSEYLARTDALISEIVGIMGALDTESTQLLDRIKAELETQKLLTQQIRDENEELKHSVYEYLHGATQKIDDSIAEFQVQLKKLL